MMLLQQHRGDEMLLRGREQFDRLLADSQTIPRVMAISVHPYITGAPHRIGYFEQLLDYIQSKKGVSLGLGNRSMIYIVLSSQRRGVRNNNHNK
jgi:hypothetical protein